jgi:hypothetical protein
MDKTYFQLIPEEIIKLILFKVNDKEGLLSCYELFNIMKSPVFWIEKLNSNLQLINLAFIKRIYLFCKKVDPNETINLYCTLLYVYNKSLSKYKKIDTLTMLGDVLKNLEYLFRDKEVILKINKVITNICWRSDINHRSCTIQKVENHLNNDVSHHHHYCFRETIMILINSTYEFTNEVTTLMDLNVGINYIPIDVIFCYYLNKCSLTIKNRSLISYIYVECGWLYDCRNRIKK